MANIILSYRYHINISHPRLPAETCMICNRLLWSNLSKDLVSYKVYLHASIHTHAFHITRNSYTKRSRVSRHMNVFASVTTFLFQFKLPFFCIGYTIYLSHNGQIKLAVTLNIPKMVQRNVAIRLWIYIARNHVAWPFSIFLYYGNYTFCIIIICPNPNK